MHGRAALALLGSEAVVARHLAVGALVSARVVPLVLFAPFLAMRAAPTLLRTAATLALTVASSRSLPPQRAHTGRARPRSARRARALVGTVFAVAASLPCMRSTGSGGSSTPGAAPARNEHASGDHELRALMLLLGVAIFVSIGDIVWRSPRSPTAWQLARRGVVRGDLGGRDGQPAPRRGCARVRHGAHGAGGGRHRRGRGRARPRGARNAANTCFLCGECRFAPPSASAPYSPFTGSRAAPGYIRCRRRGGWANRDRRYFSMILIGYMPMHRLGTLLLLAPLACLAACGADPPSPRPAARSRAQPRAHRPRWARRRTRGARAEVAGRRGRPRDPLGALRASLTATGQRRQASVALDTGGGRLRHFPGGRSCRASRGARRIRAPRRTGVAASVEPTRRWR